MYGFSTASNVAKEATNPKFENVWCRFFVGPSPNTLILGLVSSNMTKIDVTLSKWSADTMAYMVSKDNYVGALYGPKATSRTRIFFLGIQGYHLASY